MVSFGLVPPLLFSPLRSLCSRIVALPALFHPPRNPHLAKVDPGRRRRRDVRVIKGDPAGRRSSGRRAGGARGGAGREPAPGELFRKGRRRRRQRCRRIRRLRHISPPMALRVVFQSARQVSDVDDVRSRAPKLRLRANAEQGALAKRAPSKEYGEKE